MSRLPINHNLRDKWGRACPIPPGTIKLLPLAAFLLLGWVEVRAEVPHDHRFPDRQQLQAAEQKAILLEKENAELRKKTEAAERELARQRTENAQPKTDPAAAQRVKLLEKQLAEKQDQVRQSEEKARQAAKDITELRQKSAQPKTDDPAAEQRLRKLKKENAAIQRQADEADAEKQRLEKLLAEEKHKTEQAEAKLEQSGGTGNSPRPEPLITSGMGMAPASSAVGSTIKDCVDCPELVVIPSGEFVMGSPSTETDRGSDEGPQHTVRIGYSLAVGKYEVTFAQWHACVEDGVCRRPEDNGWGRGNQPVIDVSWDDIKQHYLPWLNRKAGLSRLPKNQQYRLLTEAEWEYAARAGTTTAFSFGDHITTGLANYDGNYSYNGSPEGEYRQQTVPVDSFAANAWGLYNVHGNVWEWVEDCYKDDYGSALGDGSAMQETGCSRRVLRGGSWNDYPRNLRSANRNRDTPVNRNSNSGFRLARMLP